MQRYAIFVDAGYLFAEGSKVVFGEQLPRKSLRLDVASVVHELENFASRILPEKELLRIYWYDGAPQTRGLVGPHQALADCANVKLRLGILNRHGQQKGVDTLIVTDMIELAQNRAMSDAILLSGDEDVRVGVQIAQKLGVRVYLLGVGEGLNNQSALLRQEVDVCHVWSSDILSRILARVDASVDDCIDDCLGEVHRKLSKERLEEILPTLESRDSLPQEIDRVLLGCCRKRLGRLLEDDERARLRNEVRHRLLEGQASSDPDGA